MIKNTKKLDYSFVEWYNFIVKNHSLDFEGEKGAEKRRYKKYSDYCSR